MCVAVLNRAAFDLRERRIVQKASNRREMCETRQSVVAGLEFESLNFFPLFLQSLLDTISTFTRSRSPQSTTEKQSQLQTSRPKMASAFTPAQQSVLKAICDAAFQGHSQDEVERVRRNIEGSATPEQLENREPSSPSSSFPSIPTFRNIAR